MSAFEVPLEDIDFVLNHVVDLPAVAKLNGFQHADADTVRGVLREAARFFEEVIAPLNQVGDLRGSILDGDGQVRTPPGFKEAYAKFVQAGWAGAHLPEEWGGGGLPYTVGVVIQEMFKAANMAFSLCPLLTQSGIEALISHGSPEQQAVYLGKLVTGEWSGTMCLTEPHAGSDVGALSTRAVRQEDGTYRLFGQKIFITWGDHDLTENIIHLVLARTPGSPPGTKGISMFIVPKYLLDDQGRPGARNDLKVVSIEHKLGIHASPTCVLSFGDAGEGAAGYLIGEEQAGMRYMFTMMNTARLGVGLEGLAIGEAAYHRAAGFARERQQGRPVGATGPESVAIISHPDVRRMLATMRAFNEAMRCLLYTCARAIDFADHADDPDQRRYHADLVALLTPVAKGWCTDLGVEIASMGIQVHGGMGYVEETGAAQLLRDARIAPIYEGTNGIQAIDLVLRKLPMRNGGVVFDLLDQIDATVADAGDDLADLADPVGDAAAALRRCSADLLAKAASDPDQALAGASPYLRMFGLTLGGWFHLRSAEAAIRLDGPSHPRVGLARFYCRQLLPAAAALEAAATAPESDLDVNLLV
jgi:alkylation response protein AidB-like acyl-CoA dehydrogenase